MDRRNAIKSLLSLPILALIKRIAVGQDQPITGPPADSESTFKLVFHGPFCFYRLPDGGYLAAAPELTTHDLMYGNQIDNLDTLKALSGDQYVLAQTMYSASHSLNEQQLLVVHGKYTLDPARIRCHIYMPAPLRIEAVELYRLESAGNRQALFQGGAARTLNQRTYVAIGTMLVFERKGGTEPYIRDLWNGKDGDILHFVTREKMPNTSNPNQTFKEMVKAVRGLDLNMALRGPDQLSYEGRSSPKGATPIDLSQPNDRDKGFRLLNCLAPALIIHE